jgi:hypothetical protein
MKLYEGSVKLWTEWVDLSKQGYTGVTGNFLAKTSYSVQKEYTEAQRQDLLREHKERETNREHWHFISSSSLNNCYVPPLCYYEEIPVPPIKTLYGGPEYVEGSFVVSNNELINLQYFPKFVGSYIDLSNNLLTSLDGIPENIDWSMVYASGNNLPEPLQSLFDDRENGRDY